jgi:hypothetical protein
LAKAVSLFIKLRYTNLFILSVEINQPLYL